MADSNEKLSGKVGLDNSEFKSGIAEMNRDIRVLESGFRASAAALGNWSKDATGLETRMKSLTGQIKAQEGVVAAWEAELKKVIASKGADSRATEEMQIKLNQATERLNKMKSELSETDSALKAMKPGSEQAGQGVKGLGDDSDKTGRQAVSLKGIINGLKGVLSGLGSIASGAGHALQASLNGVLQVAEMATIALIGLGIAALGAAVGIGRLVMSTARQADDLDELSQKTGISTDRLQELAYIGKQSGTDLDTMTGSMAKLVRSMDATKSYSAPAAQAFRTLGINVRDINGNLKDNEQVFGETLTALGKIEDPTKRDALAMEIFGKSAQELNPLILMGADGMAVMSDEAHKMGAVMSEEDVKAAADLNDKIDGLKMGLQGSANTLLMAFIPGLTGAADTIGGFVQRFARAIANFKDFPAAGQQMMTELVKDIILQIPKLVDTGLSIVQGLLKAIVDALPTLLDVGVQIVNSIVTSLITYLPTLMEAGTQIVLAIVTAILAALPGMFTAGMEIVQGLLNALVNALPKLLPAGIQILQELAKAVIGALPGMVTSAQTIITSLVGFLVEALPILFSIGGQILTALITGLLPMLPMLLTAGMRLLTQLMQGITTALPLIMPVMMDVINKIVWMLTTNLPALINAAMQLVMALAQGIGAALPELTPAITAMVGMIVLTLVNNLPMLINVALQLLGALAQGISQALPLLGTMALQILVALVNGIVISLPTLLSAADQILKALDTGLQKLMKEILEPVGKQMLDTVTNAIGIILAKGKQFYDIGKKIVDGVWQGILSKAEDFKKKITAFFQGIIDAVKLALGIKSPSRIFMDIGKNMTAGLWTGWSDSMKAVQRNMARTMSDLSITAGAAGLPGLGGSPAVSNTTYNFYAPVTIPAAAGLSLGESIQAKRY
jgi:phage-related protein/uncharacterized coiled-coil protein SlyX